MEVNTKADTKVCSICSKDIEVAKYRIHEATCQRNSYKCKECGEVVSKADKEHHDLEMHVPVSKTSLKTWTERA